MAEGNCVPTTENPCRVNLDLMPDGTALWMYALTALAFAVFVYGIYEMVKVWRLGADWKPGSWKAGAKRLLVGVGSHHKFMQQKRPGTMHAWLFAGFVVLFIGTTIVAIDADFFELVLDSKLLQGTGYLIFELVLDLFGVLFLVGVGAFAYRRLVEKPGHTPTKRGDLVALAMLGLVGLTGFALEAMRLQYQVKADGITYAQWSFVGNAIGAAFAGWSEERLLAVYPYMWWTHFAAWTTILAVLPWTKFKHIVTSSLNLYFHDDERQARANLPTPFNLQEVMESGSADIPSVGYQTIRDFTWKDRLALDACTNCGRCESVCPANAAGRPLSPRALIQDLKDHMWEDYKAEKVHKAGGNDGDYASPALTAVEGLETQIQEATLWSCVTCRACMTECPVDIEHVDLITEMRRGLVMESKLDEHQSKLLVNLTNAGNPYGFPASDRAAWSGALPDGVFVPSAQEKALAGESVDVLWWIGCVGSFDPRNNEVTRSLATILNVAEVDFAILGNEERCTGDPARRLGEEGRFQQSVIENLMVLQQYGVKKVITQCPHCFSTLANEYPEFGADFEVVHHTTFIEELIEAGKLPLAEGKEMKVTYHDSCYLGRHNGIYDAPRNVLEKATGLPVLEMASNKEKGMCCGAGGANMWYEIGEEKDRINVLRVKEALDVEADTVASACPFCLTMVKDGISLNGKEETVQAKDLAEIVLEHMDDPRAAALLAGDLGGAGGDEDGEGAGEEAEEEFLWEG
ncbi:MAG: heterodisulfide reductase-related iron-sulfur binding cluster [Thermoplasmatota archaeon]